LTRRCRARLSSHARAKQNQRKKHRATAAVTLYSTLESHTFTPVAKKSDAATWQDSAFTSDWNPPVHHLDRAKLAL
jgi:hypothetical protein